MTAETLLEIKDRLNGRPVGGDKKEGGKATEGTKEFQGKEGEKIEGSSTTAANSNQNSNQDDDVASPLPMGKQKSCVSTSAGDKPVGKEPSASYPMGKTKSGHYSEENVKNGGNGNSKSPINTAGDSNNATLQTLKSGGRHSAKAVSDLNSPLNSPFVPSGNNDFISSPKSEVGKGDRTGASCAGGNPAADGSGTAGGNAAGGNKTAGGDVGEKRQSVGFQKSVGAEKSGKKNAAFKRSSSRKDDGGNIPLT
jgi:hypothetical protein